MNDESKICGNCWHASITDVCNKVRCAKREGLLVRESAPSCKSWRDAHRKMCFTCKHLGWARRPMDGTDREVCMVCVARDSMIVNRYDPACGSWEEAVDD